MKLFVKICLLLFILMLFSTKTTIAQENNFDSIQNLKDLSGAIGAKKDIPGITCGDGANKAIDRCCIPSQISTDIKIEDPKFFCLPLGGPCASELPLKVFEGFMKKNKILNNLNELSKLASQNGGCVNGIPDRPGTESCKCISDALSNLCTRYALNPNDPSEINKCLKCTANNGGVWTGMGCIQVNLAGFVGSVMTIGLSLAGGLAFLCIIYSIFLLQTSRGNPERIKKAREYLTNCILGLIFIIFSVLILRIIGVDILRIPGFL